MRDCRDATYALKLGLSKNSNGNFGIHNLMILSGEENAHFGLKASILSKRRFQMKSFTCVWNKHIKRANANGVYILDGLRIGIHCNDE